MIQKTWSAKLKFLKPIQDFIEALAGEAGVNNKQSLSINLLVEEIVVNIINHAYNKNDPGKITIGFQTSENIISISFTDSGVPFNPLEAEAPDIEQDITERQIGGLGIVLVKQIADDISYTRCDNKNILTVMVNLSCTSTFP